MKDAIKKLFSEWSDYKWDHCSTLGSKRAEIVLIDKDESYGIYDKVEKTFIGFRGIKETSSNKVKFMWEKARYASAAFNNAFGHPIKNQSRYEVRKR